MARGAAGLAAPFSGLRPRGCVAGESRVSCLQEEAGFSGRPSVQDQLELRQAWEISEEDLPVSPQRGGLAARRLGRWQGLEVHL